MDKKNTQKREMLVKQLIAKYQAQTKELKDLQESLRADIVDGEAISAGSAKPGRPSKIKVNFCKTKTRQERPESIPGDQQEDNSMSSPAKKAN